MQNLKTSVDIFRILRDGVIEVSDIYNIVKTIKISRRDVCTVPIQRVRVVAAARQASGVGRSPGNLICALVLSRRKRNPARDGDRAFIYPPDVRTDGLITVASVSPPKGKGHAHLHTHSEGFAEVFVAPDSPLSRAKTHPRDVSCAFWKKWKTIIFPSVHYILFKIAKSIFSTLHTRLLGIYAAFPVSHELSTREKETAQREKLGRSLLIDLLMRSYYRASARLVYYAVLIEIN